jgi:hypothetical protein
METRRHVEFTGVELAGGAELAAPVEKTAAGPVEMAGGRRGGERGRGGKGGAVERRRRRRHGGEGVRDARRSTVAGSRGCGEFFLSLFFWKTTVMRGERIETGLPECQRVRPVELTL